MKIGSRQGLFEPMRVNKAPSQGAKKGYLFDILESEGCCVFSLESPHRGDSNEYTQYTIFKIKMKITLNYPKSETMGFCS